MKVTIIGSGIVGSAWAVVFARSGHEVVLYDTDSSRLGSAVEASKTKLNQLHEYDLLNVGDSVTALTSRVKLCPQLWRE